MVRNSVRDVDCTILQLTGNQTPNEKMSEPKDPDHQQRIVSGRYRGDLRRRFHLPNICNLLTCTKLAHVSGVRPDCED